MYPYDYYSTHEMDYSYNYGADDSSAYQSQQFGFGPWWGGFRPWWGFNPWWGFRPWWGFWGGPWGGRRRW